MAYEDSTSVDPSGAYAQGSGMGNSIAGAFGAAGSANSMAQNFGGGSSSFSSFMQGFQAGYQGTMITFGPLLAYKQAKNERAIWQAKADTASLMRQMYTDAAESALSAGHKQAAAYSYRAGQAKAKSKASIGASGVRAGVGSTAEVLASQDISKEIALNQIRVNALNSAWGFRYKAVEAQNAALSYMSAKKSISPVATAISTAVNLVVENGPKMPNLSDIMGSQQDGASSSGAGSAAGYGLKAGPSSSLFSSGDSSGGFSFSGMSGGD